jgi:hypothetical protein
VPPLETRYYGVIMPDLADLITESLTAGPSEEDLEFQLIEKARSEAGRKFLDAIKSDDSSALVKALRELKDID